MLRVIFATLALCFATTASAATYNYTYTGRSFEQFTYTLIAGSISGGRPIRGPYDPSMNVTATFSFDTALQANLNGAYLYNSVTKYSMFDGINTFSNTATALTNLQFWTDSSGSITNWDFSAVWNGTHDGDWVFSNGTTGDRAYYTYEHALPIAYGCPDCGFEGASAMTHRSGSWKLTVVPLPASLPLLGFGVIALGWFRRRQLSSAGSNGPSL